MLNGKKIVVVLPAYNAAKTLEVTCREIPDGIVDDVILVDDASRDATVETARKLGIKTIVHPHNKGYGANQKTCYRAALAEGADIIVLLHPDYQYSPRLIPAMAAMLASGDYDAVLASRILGGGALKGGMPVYKYVANTVLTMIQNVATGGKLSEYHTGFRAFTREVLETMPFDGNSDNFLFDNQILAQMIMFGGRIGEVSCPTRYFADASSINLFQSILYGLGVLKTSLQFWLQRRGLLSFSLFEAKPSVSGAKREDKAESVRPPE